MQNLRSQLFYFLKVFLFYLKIREGESNRKSLLCWFPSQWPQWPELDWSEAASQELFVGLSCGCRGWRLGPSILCCFLGPFTGSQIGSRAVETQVGASLPDMCLRRMELIVTLNWLIRIIKTCKWFDGNLVPRPSIVTQTGSRGVSAAPGGVYFSAGAPLGLCSSPPAFVDVGKQIKLLTIRCCLRTLQLAIHWRGMSKHVISFTCIFQSPSKKIRKQN